jgi:hypothetical protein
MTPSEMRRFVIAILLSVLVAASAVRADGIYIDLRGFRKWCETASNTAYILAGCWRF